MLGSVKDVLVRLSILLLLYDCVTGLIIPEELPTILSLVYSNIPPIKKGTDSRVGVGFRLGEHADFQVLLELGPQTETDPIGSSESKRRRDAMLSAAMRGELGPFAQAVARYQIERRIQKELERLKRMEDKLKKLGTESGDDKKIGANDWLSKWRKGVTQDQVPLDEVSVGTITSSSTETKPIQKRIGRPPRPQNPENDKTEQLFKLYESQTDKKTA